MRQLPPRKSSAGVVLALVGGFFAFWLFFGWLFASYQGYGVAALLSIFLAGSIWLGVFGITKRLEKKLPLAAHLGILGGIIAVFTGLGPTVSTAVEKSQESSLYEELSKDNAKASDWIDKYEKQVPEKFRRADWKLRWMKARVREGKRDKNAANLRKVANECEDLTEKDLVKPAKEDAVAALKELYDAGKAKMNTPAKAGGAREFEVSASMRDAFGTILDELSRSKDPNLYVAFKHKADLADPPGIKEALDEQKADPAVKAKFPKGDIPIIEKGQAFDVKYDTRRRATFIEAMSESFSRVFDGNLITLVPLDGDRAGKPVLEVSSHLVRIPHYFQYTKFDQPAGLLFSFIVEWEFELVSSNGKSLHKAPMSMSSPSDAKFTTDSGSPEWAPYSVMMDSAYFNYSREVTGRLGFEPPARKESFHFTKDK